MKTKIGIEVAHITRDSDTIFKVKKSKVKVIGAVAYCGGFPHSLLEFLIQLQYSQYIIKNSTELLAVNIT